MNTCGRVGNSLQAAAALPVDCDDRHLQRITGKELRNPRGHAACAWLKDIAYLHVLNPPRVNLRALEDSLKERNQHLLAWRVLECAAAGFCEGRPHRTANDHVVLCLLPRG